MTSGYYDPDNRWMLHPDNFTMPVPGADPWRVELARYSRFHGLSVASRDNDPVYPVLKHVLKQVCDDCEGMLWGCMVFVAYYDLGAAMRVLEAHPYPAVPSEELLRLPCATERRAHRDIRQLTAHLTAVVETANTHGGLLPWLMAVLDHEPAYQYANAMERLKSLHGNGRWAAYKLCDLLAEVMLPEIAPTDMGHMNSTGPRHGLELLHKDVPQGQHVTTIATLDWISVELCQFLWSEGLNGEPRIAETTLCDYHALAEGRYYVGHDTDQMQAQLTRTPSGLTDLAFTARAATLPHAYLGELNGWDGIRPELRKVFKDTGQILSPEPV